MATINMHDAKSQLSDLVARAEAGEEIVIARRNKPAVRLVWVRTSGEPLPPVELELWEHAPDDYVSKQDIAAYYRRFPQEWDDMVERVGFSESEQAPFDLTGLSQAVEAGREFTIMRDGKPVAKVAPVEKKPRVPGRFAHLRGSLPPDLFDQPLEQDELDAWDGKYSGDGDR